jgi:hypothetical protein
VVAVTPGEVVVVGEPFEPAVEVTGAVPGVAVADGLKVATNGVWTGVGRTTGMVSTSSVRVGVPNCTVVVPEAWTFCTVPAFSSPAQTVVPVDAVTTSTQHVPVPVSVIWYVVWGSV